MARGKVLELLRPNEQGKLVTVVSTDVFGCIRAIAPFRIMGAQTDYIIVGSDSGRIVLLQYDKERNAFKKVHQETYGKSGCRRLVPGQFVTVDPKGRACMIASVEKSKFVYILNRDNAANLTISSPLEAHKSNNICFSIVGLDCGFDNPIFAAIELDYSDADQVCMATMHGAWQRMAQTCHMQRAEQGTRAARCAHSRCTMQVPCIEAWWLHWCSYGCSWHASGHNCTTNPHGNQQQTDSRQRQRPALVSSSTGLYSVGCMQHMLSALDTPGHQCTHRIIT